MDEDEGLLLAGLLCARLCHDLSGPVSAVGTGAELLAEEEDPAQLGGEALELLISSAGAAAARLRFLRLALGNAGGPVPASQLRRISADFLASLTGRDGLDLDWPEGAVREWNGQQARLLANLVLLARDCLPKGGRLAVGPGPALHVVAEGPDAAPGEAVRAMSAAGATALTPRGVQGYLASRLATRAGLRLTVEATPGRVRIAIG